MRIINILVYLLFFGYMVMGRLFSLEGNPIWDKCSQLAKGRGRFVALFLVVNTISFAMTFIPEQQEIYVEKAEYGNEEREIPFLLEKGETTEEIQLVVSPQQFTKEELEETIEQAFSYLAENMAGENASLSKVNRDLDFSLDFKQFPFELEIDSQDNALVDETGRVRNDRDYLQSLGFTEQEIKEGIPLEITANLWYGEERFKQTYSILLFEKETSSVEEEFLKVIEFLKREEKKATYEEGFLVPTKVEGITLYRTDEKKITPLQVWIMGVVLILLFLFREQEALRKQATQRKERLMQSYPWFVNEMVLMLGAGMQVRNIFFMLIRDWKEEKKETDYREPLIEELGVAVRAMELGMPEEQAYYQLGRRLGIPCYIKIMTLLQQNVKRGGKGMIAFFEQEELQAFEERKNLAKRYGEEAGTKLLGPMALLLIIVMFMIIIPAFLGFA